MLLIKDHFAPDLPEIRKAVIHGEFTTETGPDGAKYTGISKHPVPQFYDRISEFLGIPITPRLSCFRLNLKGEMPHSWVHSDDICATWASVLYLNTPEQCFGGTAFWKHRVLGIDTLPTREELVRKKVNPEEFYEAMEEDWKNLGLWEQYQIVPMKFNRFVTYPTKFFHSRFPFGAFGRGPEDGRLIWICFYDRQENA